MCCWTPTSVVHLLQVFGINLMYIFGLVVGNYQYLIQDLIFCTTLAAFMSLTRPCKVLSVQQPAARVMTVELMVPVTLQLLVIGIVQVRLWGACCLCVAQIMLANGASWVVTRACCYELAFLCWVSLLIRFKLP